MSAATFALTDFSQRIWRDRMSRFVAASVLAHVLPLAGWYITTIWSDMFEKPELATIQIYMGETDVDRESTGKGKGSKDAKPNDKSSNNTGSESGEPNVDWGSADDPTIDGGTRYAAQLLVEISPEDYPASARRAGIGDVKVNVVIYISGATKRVRDVRIRNVRSPGDVHKPFEADFIAATRRVLMTKTRLLNSPYSKEGKPRDFVWDTSVTFTLQ